MPQQPFDKSSKWMLEEQGAGVLFLGGERAVLSCRALQAEVVQPRQLPDGLLEATLAGQAKPVLYLVEVATYPEKRVAQQVHNDIMLVRQARGVLPETLVLVLRQRGKYRVPDRFIETSVRGSTTSSITWKVVELWGLPAEELLSAPNVGTVPWATLGQHEGPPEVLLQRCRDRIDRDGGSQQANLLAVAQVFARLRFDRPEWLRILGGRKAMIESPLIQEIVDESKQEATVAAIVKFLTARLAAPSDSVKAGLAQIKQADKLDRLLTQAALCSSLEEFEERLRKELPAQPPVSTRGKRRSRKPST